MTAAEHVAAATALLMGTDLADSIDAQVHATLALVEQQETANLIAFTAGIKYAGSGRSELHELIEIRLGLDVL